MYSNSVTDMELTGVEIHKTSTPFPVDATHVSVRRRNHRLEGASTVPSDDDLILLMGGDSSRNREDTMNVPTRYESDQGFRKREGTMNVPTRYESGQGFRNREDTTNIPTRCGSAQGVRDRKGGAIFVPPGSMDSTTLAASPGVA